MMHTLRNCKIGLKRAKERFAAAWRTSQAAVSPHVPDEIRDSDPSFQASVGFKTRV
jgi:hypothetical protein